MAINSITAKAGYDQTSGLAVITGLTKATFRKVNATYQPVEQPKVVYAHRLITIEQTAADTAQDFWGKPRSEWTIRASYTTGGVEKVLNYNVVVLDSSLVIEDGDVRKFVTILGMTQGELDKVLAKTRADNALSYL